ncbi:prephenate dehydrogenase [Shimia isoporae]|uniref:Prephenate dehydrogenase n=1 Tax=Shimia isoporae TaxID=647720 RepID=A0A4R1NP14_9RHOB|nr:prephenate dehydrogenase [Shimia isoporae]TCL10216.1 prephenate dehydrogenase [Shimia isoporae]
MGHTIETNRPLTLGLFGFGAFGKLVARELADHFEITVCDPAYVGAVLEDGRAFAMRDAEETARADIVVLAVPVARIAHVCQQIAPHIRVGALVVDVGSVKTAPMGHMAKHLPRHANILGTHPLFGPQSAKSGIADRKIAICRERGNRQRVTRRFLRSLGLEVIETTAEAHDREAAMVQGLTHLIAKVLNDLGPLPDQMTTVSFDLLREAVGMVKNDPPTVLHAIEVANPYAAEIRNAFFDRAEKIRAQFEAV